MDEIRVLQSMQMGYGNISQVSLEEGLKWNLGLPSYTRCL